MIEKETNLQDEIKVYETNPSITSALRETVIGYRNITSKSKSTEITVYNNDDETEKELRELVFSMKQEVDKSQFVKLFMSGFKTLSELKAGAQLLFEYVFNLIQKTIGSDKLYISYNDYKKYCKEQDIECFSKVTFYKHLKELLLKEVLFKSDSVNIYFINVSYIFNGDRLTFLKQYALKKD